MARVDPKLLRRIEAAGENDIVSAVLILARQLVKGAGTDEDLSPEGVVAKVAEETHEKPEQVQFMSRLGIVSIRASGGFIKRLLGQPAVVSATVPDAEVTKAGRSE